MMIFLVIIIMLYFFITYVFFILLCKKFNRRIITKFRNKIYKNVGKYKDIIDTTTKWLDEKSYEKVFIKSFDNLKLSGLLINNEKEKGIIVIFHGYRSDAVNNLFLSYPYFYDLGYSILLVNQRTCMDSEGKYITFGAKEKEDVISWIKYVNKRFKKQNIVLVGISMGATSILLSTKNITKDMNIKLLIADSGYISGYDEVKRCFKVFFHINGAIFMLGINLWCKLIANFNLKMVNTLSELSKCDIPLLFFHDKFDKIVPVDDSIKNYDSYTGKKDIILFEESKHAMCYLSDPDKYINGICKYMQ